MASKCGKIGDDFVEFDEPDLMLKGRSLEQWKRDNPDAALAWVSISRSSGSVNDDSKIREAFEVETEADCPAATTLSAALKVMVAGHAAMLGPRDGSR